MGEGSVLKILMEGGLPLNKGHDWGSIPRKFFRHVPIKNYFLWDFMEKSALFLMPEWH